MNKKLLLLFLSLMFILSFTSSVYCNDDAYAEHLIVNFYQEEPMRRLVDFPMFYDENRLYVWNPSIMRIYKTYNSNGLCPVEEFSSEGFVVGNYKEAFIHEMYQEKIISYVILDKQLNINDILEGIVIRNGSGGFAANVEEYDYEKHSFIARIWLLDNNTNYWNVARKPNGGLTLVFLPTN